jgi:hypothetical protein
MKTSYAINKIGTQVIELLQKKNSDYGDSATEGDSIFATDKNKDSMSAKEFGLCCRIDDKLHRIKNSGITDETEDSVWDLAGYFILLLIVLMKRRQ